MPVTPTYPGVYVEEIPSGSRTITGVATSITAFIGRGKKGPTDEPILINNYGEFERIFGGLWEHSDLGFAVRDFYNNGGSQAVIVRLFNPGELQAKDKTELDAVLAVVDKIKKAEKKEDGIQQASTLMTVKISDIQKPEDWPEPDKWKGKIGKKMAETIFKLNDAEYKTKVEMTIEKFNCVTTKAVLSVETLVLEAAAEGAWGNDLRARVDYNGIDTNATKLFNLSVRDGGTGVVENFLNVSVDPDATRYVKNVLEKDSKLVRVFGNVPDERPKSNLFSWEGEKDKQGQVISGTDVKKKVEEDLGIKAEMAAIDQKSIETDLKNKEKAEIIEREEKKFNAEGLWYKHCSSGVEDKYKAGDGELLGSNNFTKGQSEKKGIYALENADLFNLLCIPPYKDDKNVDQGVITAAINYCEKRRAMLIIDAPSGWGNKEAAKDGIDGEVGSTSKNAAIFFPRLKMPNPLKDNQIEIFAACGAVAGVMARTDATRGVWKAPAGLDAVLRGVSGLSVPLTDPENGELNPLGINCLRVKPPAGKIIWGARTRVGNDMLTSEWKYIPVRRLALYLEETLYRNTKWAVFEPNDEPLWSQLRLSIGAFMNNLFRQGAFQGSSPKDAYFVKCDKETTTQYDIDRGIVNIMIGYAPLKPAEFVILKFQQIAGQS